MEMPLISVIIPCLNAQFVVATALGSLRVQNCRDFEVIVADGASTDNTLAIVESFRTGLPALRVLSGKDRGVYDGINHAIEVSLGRWIYVLGSDDCLADAGVLDSVAKQLRLKRADFMYGDVLLGAPIPGAPNAGRYRGETSLENLLQKNICQQSIFYSRRLFDHLGLFKLKYRIYADWEFNVRAMALFDSQWIDVAVCNYAATGMSAHRIDHVFLEDRAMMMAGLVFRKPFNTRILTACWWLRDAATQALSAKQYRQALPLHIAAYWLTLYYRFVRFASSAK